MHVMFIDGVLIRFRESLNQSLHAWQALLETSIVIINITDTTYSCVFASGLEAALRILKTIVVVQNVLQSFSVSFILVMNESKDTFEL